MHAEAAVLGFQLERLRRSSWTLLAWHTSNLRQDSHPSKLPPGQDPTSEPASTPLLPLGECQHQPFQMASGGQATPAPALTSVPAYRRQTSNGSRATIPL